MYIDGVIVFSLVILVLIIAMMVYIAHYAKRHIDQDVKKAKEEEQKSKMADALLGD